LTIRRLTTRLAYNGDGVRTSKTVAGDTTEYTLDLMATLPAVISDTEAVYLYGLDVIAQQQAERLYYVHDGLGSVRQLVHTTGQIETNYTYDPFGVPLVGGEVYNPYQYTGEAWDAGLELLYLRARYYQPGVGRFITKDPWPGNVRQPGSLNAYVYSLNNAVSSVDRTGLQCKDGVCGPEPSQTSVPQNTSAPGSPAGGTTGTGTPTGGAPVGTTGPTAPPQPSPVPGPQETGTPRVCRTPTAPATPFPAPPISFEQWKAHFPADPYSPLWWGDPERVWMAFEAQVNYLANGIDIGSAAQSKTNNPLKGGADGQDYFGRWASLVQFCLNNSRRPPFPTFIKKLRMDTTGKWAFNFEPFFLTLLTTMHRDALERAQDEDYLQFVEDLSGFTREEGVEAWGEILEKILDLKGVLEDMYTYSTTQE
jgi:RHS repeat-associated protein